MDLGAPDAGGEIAACAGCHAHRQQINHVDRHARPFLDDFLPSTLRADLYYPDGQIRDEVYVWGSFAQSRMYRAGVRCSNCHDPHGLGLRATGNALCVRCHRETPNERFPTLRTARYDTPAHHFHEPGSAGAQCVSCHMPARTYMVVDPRRDHSFRAPRPDLSAALGTPNACTSCHTEKTAAWAAARAAAWWGTSPSPHFGEVLAAARRGDRTAESGLLELARDSGQPPIVRATALEHLRPYGPRALPAAAAAAVDPDPLVRAAAAGVLERVAPRRRVAALVPLLDDPVRAVRIEAARALTSVPRPVLGAEQAARFDAALAEYVAAQAESADLPGAHLNLGILQARGGAAPAAERSYRRALDLDAAFAPARFNLANLLNRQGRNPEAEAVLRAGLERAPEDGELHYSLGLLLAEEQRFEAAAASLERAAARMPARSRVGYNLGMVLLRLDRLAAAEAALLGANAADPRDPDVLAALVQVLARRGETTRARTYREALRRLDPAEPAP